MANFFLSSQRISALTGVQDAGEIRHQVCGIADESASSDVRMHPPNSPWKAVSRDDLLSLARGKSPPLRTALLCDAGLGKSTNLHWLEAQIGEQSGQLPLFIALDEPDGRKHLRREMEASARDVLLGYLAKKIFRVTNSPLSHECLVHALRRVQAQGRITLLIDGLDHILDNSLAPGWIHDLMSSAAWCRCPIWITGRPYAFKEAWKDLFDGQPWRFLRIEPLTRADIRRYLKRMAGGDWYDEIPNQGRQLLTVPRFLRLVAEIFRKCIPAKIQEGKNARDAIAELQLDTAADIYHRAYFDEKDYYDVNLRCLLGQGLVGPSVRIGLPRGVRPDEANYGHRIHRIGTLLAALAFEMMSRTTLTTDTRSICDGAVGDELFQIQTKVIERLKSKNQGEQTDFWRDYTLLTKLGNKTIDFLLFREASQRGLVWHDRTVQAFFATHWATKFGNQTDLNTIGKWIFDDAGRNLPAFDQFWQFTAQIPDPLIDKQCWLNVVRPWYAPPATMTGSDNLTQWRRRMIYLSYRRMLRRSKETLTKWRERSPEQQRLVDELSKGFRVVKAGRCAYGAVPPHVDVTDIDIVNDLFMHEWPVINRTYEAFDPSHKYRRWKNRYHNEEHPLAQVQGYGGEDYCPVVNVSFYDSWCFAKWCSDDYRLPTEHEWEHACRAGGKTLFFFGNRNAELVQHAWYYSNSGGHTRPVPTDPKKEESIDHRNGNMLYDMHGNVWEWCDSLRLPGAWDFVLRGGCWYEDEWNCRSAAHYELGPGTQNQFGGFRLAADPAMESSQVNKSRAESQIT